MIDSKGITRGSGVALMVFFAFVLSAGLVILPLKLSLVAWGLVLSVAACLIILKLPDSARPSYRLIFSVLAVAIASKFLWPSFAYLPIAALPTKNPQRMLWALAIAYWAYSLATNRELRDRLGRRLVNHKLSWIVGLFFIWRYITACASEEPFYSLMVVTTESFDHLTLFLLTLTWIRQESDILRLSVWFSVILLVIACVVAVEVPRQQNVFSSLVPVSELNEAMVEAKFRGGAYRAQATFNHPILLAQFVVSITPLVLLLLRKKLSRSRGLAALALLCIPITVFFAKSRAGYAIAAVIFVSIGAIAIARALRNRTSPRIAMLSYAVIPFVLCGVVAVAAFIANVTAGRDQDEARSSYARVQMLEQSSKLAADEPILGYGPAVGAYRLGFVAGKGRLSLDSYYLILVLDSGIPALALFLGVMAASVLVYFSTRKAGDHRRNAAEAYLLSMFAWAGFALILGTSHNLALFFMAAAVLICIADLEPKIEERSESARSFQPRSAQQQRS